MQRWVEALDIAGPGFVNLRLTAEARQRLVREVLSAGTAFGQRPPHGSRVMVEFVSANPTGPLHVGHGRNAALGDCVCNLLQSQGWSVTREFYYNDAGVQIATLGDLGAGASARPQAGRCASGPRPPTTASTSPTSPSDFLAVQDGARRRPRGHRQRRRRRPGWHQPRFAVAYLRHEQDLDLRAFGVRFDTLLPGVEPVHRRPRRAHGGRNSPPPARPTSDDGALWLRSTDYGDDKDRVMRKSDGSYTYFVPDVAYHVSKWERGFAK